MGLSPVKQSELKLRKLRNKVFPRIVAGKLFLHIRNHFRNARIVFVLLHGYEQIQLRIFLNFNAEIKQLLNRRVAGEEVIRTRTKGNDFQFGKANYDAGLH